MLSAIRFAFKHGLRVVFYGAVGVVLTLLFVFVRYLDNRPDLELWHLAELDEEYTADSPVANFSEYLELEGRLFQQLDELVYDRTGSAGNDRINRYKRGSLSDPGRWSPDWNRSFLMMAPRPAASVLLLHGLSDSPYSLRNIGQRLHAAGATVLGLRVPGHGTAPSGLLKVRWQDMAAAVRLAARHLEAQEPGAPLYIVGYSNGAALGVHYALSALYDPGLPPVDGLVLISPEIGVTAAAAFAAWQARLGLLLGLDKLAWNEILPEYDPFKYGSFAVNAGDLSHRITGQIQRQLGAASVAGKLGRMPPILAFSSVVDATVLAPALVTNLYNRLPAGRHELVLFDINAQAGIEPLLRWRPDEMLEALQQTGHATYTLSLVTNEHEDSPVVVERSWLPGEQISTETALGLRWPENVYSLTHVALPFPPGDPLYGGSPGQASPGIELGRIALRGERNVLHISAAEMLRLRWNPFYPYLEQRIVEFIGLESP
jgi:alpha-beta hydrolase superfamily lysophospholipase